jgi:tetratricopeptide (TPR) repeat protein
MIDRLLERIALAAVLLLSFAGCLRKVWSADFWWQYKTGELVAQQGWPFVDSFSYTALGAPWIELRWLFCLGQYEIMQWWGTPAIVLLKWLAVVAAFLLVSLPVWRRRSIIPTALVLTVALLASSQRFFVRPELSTYVFLGIFVLILDRYRKHGGRVLLVLPLIQILWVNSHPLFIFGPLLVGLLFVTQALRRKQLLFPGVVCGLTLLACLVNPYGFDGLLLPFKLFSEVEGSLFSDVISELQSPFKFGSGYTAVLYYKILIGLCVASGLWNWRRLDPFWSLLCLAQLYLSTLSIRSLPLFCLAAVPFIIDNINRAPRWKGYASSRVIPVLRRAVAVLLIVGCGWYALEMMTNRFYLKQNDSNQFGTGIADHRYPTAAVDVLLEINPGGQVFGGLLESAYMLSRDIPVFVDPRLEIYGEPLFKRFLAVRSDAGEWQRAVQEYDIRTALIDLRSPLTGILRRDPAWRLIYFDNRAAIFSRDDSATGWPAITTADDFQRQISRLREEEPSAYPQPYLAVAEFLLTWGLAEEAAPFLDDAEKVSPYIGGPLHRRRVTLKELQRDYPGMIDEAQAALEDTPGDARLLMKVGEGYYRLCDLEQAEAWLRRSVEAAPGMAPPWAALGRIKVEQQRFEEAEQAFSRAVELAPANATFISNLARIRARLGRIPAAIEGLQQALTLEPKNLTAVRDLAGLLWQQGERAAALATLDQGLVREPANAELLRLREQFESAAPQ